MLRTEKSIYTESSFAISKPEEYFATLISTRLWIDVLSAKKHFFKTSQRWQRTDSTIIMLTKTNIPVENTVKAQRMFYTASVDSSLPGLRKLVYSG